jgi:hypothetical protein
VSAGCSGQPLIKAIVHSIGDGQLTGTALAVPALVVT